MRVITSNSTALPCDTAIAPGWTRSAKAVASEILVPAVAVHRKYNKRQVLYVPRASYYGYPCCDEFDSEVDRLVDWRIIRKNDGIAAWHYEPA